MTKKVLERTSFLVKFRLSSVIPEFLVWARVDQRLSEQTIGKYQDSIKKVIKIIGDVVLKELNLEDFTRLKAEMFSQGIGEARVAGVLFAMKSLLKYCRNIKKLKVLNPAKIKVPRKPRREVIFLTNEEVHRFIETINTKTLYGLRFRTLVEVLLGTAMRISEALSLDRDSIDYAKREAKIIGKGNKERTVFFNDRALSWVRKYSAKRWDYNPAIFVTHCNPQRLNKSYISRYFRIYRKKAGLKKKVSASILRHTVATNLLFNGCPISHVKEILGHERLETTCKYYLGLDKSKAKKAHSKFLNFEN